MLAATGQRSDRFDFGARSDAGRRGLAALGNVIEYWIKHLLDIEVIVEPLTELRDVALSWYVGLDRRRHQDRRRALERRGD